MPKTNEIGCEANSQLGISYDSLLIIPDKEKSIVNKDNIDDNKESENKQIINNDVMTIKSNINLF